MSKVWSVIQLILHAVVWWLAVCVAATPVGLLLGLGLSHWFSDFGPALASVIVLPIVVYVWVLAVSRRWSATWPVVFLSMVFWTGFWWVTMIGLGKLIIHAVGRGGEVAASDIPDAVLEARPRGMVEYASYD